MKKAIALITLMAFSTVAWSQTGRTDMAKEDITAMEHFDGASVSFRGLYLGIGKEEAIAALNKMADYTWNIDAFNTKSVSPTSDAQMRIYVSVKDKAGLDDPAVLYLQWEQGKRGMNAMVFYKALSRTLPTSTATLFTSKALDPACSCRKFLKGDPINAVDNIGIHTYSFPQQHFQLISMKGDGAEDDVWFKLIK
jgi:hypothetical protein